MNQLIITGNLGKDPNVRMAKTGNAVASFSVAVSRKNPNGEGFLTTWINVVAFKKLAESVGNQLKKGARVIVTGHLQTRSYESNGQKRWATELVAEDIGILLQKAESKGNFNQFSSEAQDEPIPF